MPVNPDRAEYPIDQLHRHLVRSLHPERRADFIPYDTGPKFITKAVRDWIAAVGEKTADIEPEST